MISNILDNISNKENLPEGYPKILYSVYSNDKIIYQKHFPNTATFSDLIEDFESNIKDPQIKSKIEYNFKKKKVNKKDRIIDINKVEKNTKLIEIDVSLDFTELKIPKNKLKETNRINKIIKPESNPFHLISYSPNESNINLETYSQKEILEYSLNDFSEKSAYCNSNDTLFISGGEKNGKPINDFWTIGHNRKILEHSEMPICKSNHSMIFIPENYILITGGNNKDSLLYDIEKKVFIKWGNMNEINIKPALCVIDNGLVYSFNEFNGGKKFFEKTDLKSIPVWEKITPKGNLNNFDLKNFAVGKNLNGDIILFGGNNLGKSKKCFKYDIEKNELKNIDTPNEIIEFNDKNFYPINKYTSINIPNDFNKNKDLIVLNKKKETFKKIPFDINQEEKIINDQMDYKYPNNIGIGSFTIKSKSKQIPDIEVEEIFNEINDEKNQKNKNINIPKPQSKIKGTANISVHLKKLLSGLQEDDKNNNLKKSESFNISGIIPGEKNNRLKENDDIISLSIPKIQKGLSTNLDLPPPEKNEKKIKIEEPKIEIETLNDEIIEKEDDPGKFHPITVKNPNNKKLKIPLSSYGSNIERDISNNKIEGIKGVIHGIKNKDKIEVNVPNVNIDNNDINIKGSIPGNDNIKNSGIYNLEPTIKYEMPNFTGGKDFKRTEFKDDDEDENKIENNITTNIKVKNNDKPDVKSKVTTKENDINNNIDIKGIVPGVEKKGNIEVNVPNPKTNLTNVDVNVDINDNNSDENYIIGSERYAPLLLKNIITKDVDSPIYLNKMNILPNNIEIDEINGVIDGKTISLPNQKLRLPQMKISGKYLEKGSNINVDGGNININAPKINAKVNDEDIKETNIKGVVPGVKEEINFNSPEIDTKGMKVNVHAPKVDINAPKVESKVDINAPKVDINKPKVESKVDINAPKVDINAPKIDSKVDINAPKVNINAPKVNPNIKGPNVNINIPNVNIPLKKTTPRDNIVINYNGNLLRDIITRDVDAPIGLYKKNLIPGDIIDVEGVAGEIIGTDNIGKNYQLTVPEGNININAPKVGIKSIMTAPNTSIENPDLEIKGNEINGSNIELNNSKTGLKVKGSANIPNVNIKENKSINITEPKIEKNKEKINVSAPKISIPSSKTSSNIEPPKLNIKPQEIKPKYDFNMPKEIKSEIKGSSIDIKPKKIEVNAPKVEPPKIKNQKIEIKSPKVEMKSPSKIESNPINISPKKSNPKIEAPKIQIPQIKTKTEIKSPKVKAEIEIPDEENFIKSKNQLNIPIKTSKLEDSNTSIKAPNISLKTSSSKEIENEPKIKKKFSLSIPRPNPKEEEIETGIKIQPHISVKPRMTLTKPEIKKNINIETPKISMKNHTSNNQSDTQIPKIIMKNKTLENQKKKSNFKLHSPENSKEINNSDDINFLTKKSSKIDLENKDYIPSLTDLMSMDVNEKINLNNFDNDIKYNKYGGIEISNPDYHLNYENRGIEIKNDLDLQKEFEDENIKLKNEGKKFNFNEKWNNKIKGNFGGIEYKLDESDNEFNVEKDDFGYFKTINYDVNVPNNLKNVYNSKVMKRVHNPKSKKKKKDVKENKKNNESDVINFKFTVRPKLHETINQSHNSDIPIVGKFVPCGKFDLNNVADYVYKK